jgi:hypothetical protein
MIERLRRYAREAGRDPNTLGLERRINYAGGLAECERAAAEWRRLGGTHLSVNTMRAGLPSPQAHIDAMRAFRGLFGRDLG